MWGAYLIEFTGVNCPEALPGKGEAKVRFTLHIATCPRTGKVFWQRIELPSSPRTDVAKTGESIGVNSGAEGGIPGASYFSVGIYASAV